MNEPALTALPPGELVRLRRGDWEVAVSPSAGGRIAQITVAGFHWLVGPDEGHAGAISWGAYPMLPWAGRIRHGRFAFEGRSYQLPVNLGPHAIHGTGFDQPWQVLEQSDATLRLGLSLDDDGRWPFGGQAEHAVELQADRLRLRLRVTAGERAMPRPVVGWHPWFRKLAYSDFAPSAYYPRDAEGIATLPLAPPPGPLDDCYLNDQPVRIEREGRRLELRSDCHHWVHYDEPEHATCLEPQSGPPDCFNLHAGDTLLPGESVEAWFELVVAGGV